MRSTAAALCALVVALPAWAHGPSRQKVVETIEIAAPPAAVWPLVGDFNGLPKWHPAVADSRASDGSRPGSERTLTLAAGGTVVETLETVDEQQMSLRYRYRSGVLPVSNYAATIALKPTATGTLVEWKGAFYRGYPNNDPPPDQNDEAAVQAITDVYRSGLAGLKRAVEAGR